MHEVVKILFQTFDSCHKLYLALVGCRNFDFASLCEQKCVWSISHADLFHAKDRLLVIPIEGVGVDVDPSTICQYTGLKDKEEN